MLKEPKENSGDPWISATFLQQDGHSLCPFTPSDHFPLNNIKKAWGLSEEASPSALLSQCLHPRPQQWTNLLQDCCCDMLYRAGSFQSDPSDDLWPRRPDPNVHWEVSFSSFAKYPWCLASVLDQMVAFERPSPDGRPAFPTPSGAIMFYYEKTTKSQDHSKHILPGEVKCANHILQLQQHFRTERKLKLDSYRARIINITPESIRVLNASCTCNDKELAPIHFEIEYILPFDKLSVSDFEDGWYTIAQLGTEWKVDDALHADVPESPYLAILQVRSSSPSTREKGKRDGSGESKGSEKSGKSDKSETPTENLGDDGLDDDAKSDGKPDRVFDSPTR